MTTDDEKTVYALGLMMAQSLSMFNLSPAELEIVKRALSDAASGKPAIELSEWGAKDRSPGTQPLRQRRRRNKRQRPRSTLPSAPLNPGPSKPNPE